MTRTFQDLVVGGVFLTQIVGYALLAIACTLVLRPVLHRIGFSNWFVSPPLAELSLYVSLFGLIILLL